MRLNKNEVFMAEKPFNEIKDISMKFTDVFKKKKRGNPIKESQTIKILNTPYSTMT